MANDIMMAWHYTRGHGFREIMKCGFLSCANAGIPESEKPVLWFTINQLWEPTVNGQILQPDGSTKTRTLSETRETEGCFRFGVPSNLLIPWIDLVKAANISYKWKKALESTARRCGSNPYHWYGYMQPMDIRETVIEVMNDNIKWVSAESMFPEE